MNIGIVCRMNEDKRRYQVSSALINRLIEYQITPILIFPEMDLSAMVKICDGCIISGGDDVHPFYYGEKMNSLLHVEDAKIEALDFACLDCFIKAHKPVLGICRGIQVIGVAFGSKLMCTQDHAQGRHVLQVHPHSLFYPMQKEVGTYHHQMLSTVPKGFLLSASANGIEAIEKKDVFAVQWHPELEKNDLVIPNFLEYIRNKQIEQNE